MNAYARQLRAMLCDDGAAALVEYAIIAAAIAVPLIGLASTVTTTAGTTLTNMTAGMQNVGANPP